MSENKENIYIGLEGYINLHSIGVSEKCEYEYDPVKASLYIDEPSSAVFISSKPISAVAFAYSVDLIRLTQANIKYAGSEIHVLVISKNKDFHGNTAAAVIDLDLVGGATKPCAAAELFACQSKQKNHWPVIGYVHNQCLSDAAFGDTTVEIMGPLLLASRNIFAPFCPKTLGDMVLELLGLDTTGDITHHVPKALEEIVLAYEEGTMDSDTYASLGKVHGEAFVSLVCSLLEKEKLVSVGFSLPGYLSNLGKFLKTYWENTPPDGN